MPLALAASASASGQVEIPEGSTVRLEPDAAGDYRVRVEVSTAGIEQVRAWSQPDRLRFLLLAGEHLHREDAEAPLLLLLAARDRLQLVDDRADARPVLLEQHLADERLVRRVLGAQVDVRDVAGVDPVSLVAHEKVMVTVDAVKQFEEMLA